MSVSPLKFLGFFLPTQYRRVWFLLYQHFQLFWGECHSGLHPAGRGAAQARSIRDWDCWGSLTLVPCPLWPGSHCRTGSSDEDPQAGAGVGGPVGTNPQQPRNVGWDLWSLDTRPLPSPASPASQIAQVSGPAAVCGLLPPLCCPSTTPTVGGRSPSSGSHEAYGRCQS